MNECHYDGPVLKAFAPGRTELAGNHTDHQHGQVIAATITEGLTAYAQQNDTALIRVASEGYAPFCVDVRDLAPHDAEHVSPAALVRGMAAGFDACDVTLRGFDLHVESTLPAGGGLSSSAAFELLVGVTLNALFAQESVPPSQMARMAQAAERDFFGKPCGLMDQAAIAHGGIVDIDLADPEEPAVTRIAFDFEAAGYAVLLVDVGCDHSRFTAEYARIPRDMRAVAQLCGARVLGDVVEDMFMERFGQVREELGDRAVLRGLHFYRENDLTRRRALALRLGDMDAFLQATEQSGISSAEYLQNVFCGEGDQPAMVALAIARRQLDGYGACRIHGGGFGGSIQAFVPLDRVSAFTAGMERYLGDGCCRMLQIGSRGAHTVWM